MKAALSRELSGAFWAAYAVFSGGGVSLAHVRVGATEGVMTTLLEERRQHGMGRMLYLAQCQPVDRQGLVVRIWAALPETYTSVTRSMVDAAVVAAARALAEG